MRRRVLLVLALLAAITVASFAFPRAMLSPGDLVRGHRELEADCFACHAPFRGPDGRCLACHELEKIDAADSGRPAFHSMLADPVCSACHADHRGRAAARATVAFRHDLLRETVRGECAACHAAPDDELHRAGARECATCHSVDGWKPATFDHDRYFRFDRDHPGRCGDCHPTGFGSYTCYGCHEHRPGRIESEHREEGLTDIGDCARCHRSAEEIEAEDHRRGRGRRRGRDDDDDD